MKPTKEQLDDPKWWDEQTISESEFCYWNDSKESLLFSSEELSLDFSGFSFYELLAKRPEAKWVPEVGEWCESTYPAKWSKVYYVGKDQEGSCVMQLINGECVVLGSLVEFRPLKTQREELIDLIRSLHNYSKEIQVDAILAKYELTEKDGE